jgi:hypothetical protein
MILLGVEKRTVGICETFSAGRKARGPARNDTSLRDLTTACRRRVSQHGETKRVLASGDSLQWSVPGSGEAPAEGSLGSTTDGGGDAAGSDDLRRLSMVDSEWSKDERRKTRGASL